MPDYRRVVVKLGTNLITGGKDSLDNKTMQRLVAQVAQLHKRGFEMLLVTSGAVAAGKHRLGIRKKRRDVPFRQMMAAVGQGQLMQAYDALFSEHGIVVAQTLLTRPDCSNRLGYLNTRNTLLELLAMKVVPIINENDVVFVEELEGATFGDNDNLSAMVANLVDADLLIILSDVEGLYDMDPNKHADAKIIKHVEQIDSAIEKIASGKCGERGTGGMATKIQAAQMATASGTAVVIAAGQAPDVITRIADGEALGTFFVPSTSKIESRKRWMISLPAKGQIVVDAGAQAAIAKGNKSLLPAGIVSANGNFNRGDIVRIVDESGSNIAAGITNYNSSDISKIKGQPSSQILQLLGHEYGEEVIHRDNLAKL